MLVEVSSWCQAQCEALANTDKSLTCIHPPSVFSSVELRYGIAAFMRRVFSPIGKWEQFPHYHLQISVLKLKTKFAIVLTLALTSFIASAIAQEVIIPDPGLNAAIRQALEKPNGPLTETDLLGLTNLIADARNITNLAGLEAARNLTALSLQSN